MIELASLIVVNLLIAAFIGILIGFFLGRATKVSYTPPVDNTDSMDESKVPSSNARKTSINPIFRKNSSVDNKPLILSSPRQSGKDNLKKIKGITEQTESDLNALGIFHFDQISKWTNKNADWIEEFLQISGCIKKFQWIDQARILESGKETVYSQKIENNEIIGDEN